MRSGFMLCADVKLSLLVVPVRTAGWDWHGSDWVITAALQRTDATLWLIPAQRLVKAISLMAI